MQSRSGAMECRVDVFLGVMFKVIDMSRRVSPVAEARHPCHYGSRFGVIDSEPPIRDNR